GKSFFRLGAALSVHEIFLAFVAFVPAIIVPDAREISVAAPAFPRARGLGISPGISRAARAASPAVCRETGRNGACGPCPGPEGARATAASARADAAVAAAE